MSNIDDVLDDLCSRFLLNIPEKNKNDIIRLLFEMELAHWFYCDVYREENSRLPPLRLKDFVQRMLDRFKFLPRPPNMSYDEIFNAWRVYKQKVATFGAIMIDPSLEYVLLVQGCQSSNWGYPKGKRNEDELAITCAIREVKEETGYDITGKIDRDNFTEHVLNQQLSRLYYAPGVPMDTEFKAECKYEIKEWRWFRIDDLPETKNDTYQPCGGNKRRSMFMVYPYTISLKKYIKKLKSERRHNQKSLQTLLANAKRVVDQPKSVEARHSNNFTQRSSQAVDQKLEIPKFAAPPANNFEALCANSVQHSTASSQFNAQHSNTSSSTSDSQRSTTSSSNLPPSWRDFHFDPDQLMKGAF